MCSEINDFSDKYQELIQNFEPKLFKEEYKKDILSIQIWNLYVVNKQTKQSYESKIEIWFNLQKSLLRSSNSSHIYIMGSVVNGFGLNNGDIDLTIINSNTNIFDDRNNALSTLIRFESLIKTLESYNSINLIKANVPILRFFDVNHRIEIDLSANNILGVKNTYLLRMYSMIDWRVRPLVVIVKLWARKFNINNARNNTLSSYSLTLMVIHFLQCAVVPKILPNLQNRNHVIFGPHMDIRKIDFFTPISDFRSENKESLGDLLLGFFRYYKSFRFEESIISIRLGKAVSNYSYTISPNFEYKYINIEEPFNLTNTAYAIYKYPNYTQIVHVFKKSYETLMNTHDLFALL